MFTREFPSFHPHLCLSRTMHRIPLRNSARKVALAAASRVSSPTFSPLFARLNMPTEQRTLVAHLCYRQAWFVLSFPHSTARLLADFLRPSRLVSHSIRRFAAASEVSSILESRISGTSVGGNVEETGRVLSAPVFMPWPFIILLTIFFQVSVTVSDAFGVSRTCKV